MDKDEIATKQHLNQAVLQLMDFIKEFLGDSRLSYSNMEYDGRKYLRTRDVLKLLSVSRNKLKDMRLKGEIPFIKKGSTFFYPEEELHSTFL